MSQTAASQIPQFVAEPDQFMGQRAAIIAHPNQLELLRSDDAP